MGEAPKAGCEHAGDAAGEGLTGSMAHTASQSPGGQTGLGPRTAQNLWAIILYNKTAILS